MSDILDYFDSINIDVAKRKYYNVNKVNAVLEELRAKATDLVEENERQRLELDALRGQLAKFREDGRQSEELLTGLQELYRETMNKAHTRADGILQDAQAQSSKLLNETEKKREAVREQVRECFGMLRSREEDNLRFLKSRLDRTMMLLNEEPEQAENTERAELPSETSRTRFPTPESAADRPSLAPADGTGDTDSEQFKEMELRIRQLAEEIRTMELGDS